jgi:flagellar hook-basal body complex protein FliE
VKSEELEVSLRTEFENYLKNVLADMKQEFAQVQEKIEVEVEKHKSQLDDVFKNSLNRVQSDVQLDEGFKDAVMEHLRLAKDEGAQITVKAMEEAEELGQTQTSAKGTAEFAINVRDAVNDISSKQSQAEILKTLIHHCEDFVARGVFFIIKNEHFVGWRTFGKDRGETEEVVREVFFSTSEQSLLSEANKFGVVVSNLTAKGNDESLYLSKLGFGKAEKMYAVPLVVRGRGVAVLYADSGEKGSIIQIEAIESLAKVASLTVELLASAKAGSKVEEKAKTKSLGEKIAKPETSPLPEITNFVASTPKVEVVEEHVADTQTSHNDYGFQKFETTPTYTETNFDDDSIETVSTKEEPSFATESWGKPKVEFDDYSSTISAKPSSEYEFETTTSYEVPKTKTDHFEVEQIETETFAKEEPVSFEDNSFTKSTSFENNSYNEVSSLKEEMNSFEAETPSFDKTSFGNSFEAETKPAVEDIVQPVSTAPVKSRFSERNVDLPIDVAEDERRLHNDARRFARLLVSEIKLYNEQKVKEGRESSDLYDRLREAIDRSREMYDKRVQPPVAQKFDYFHYELVNTLAEGEEEKLGGGYSGSNV